MLLALATLVTAASLGLVLPTAHAVYCDRLAPLAVLAALAATLIALCFRSLAQQRDAKPGAILLLALALSAAALFLSAAFIRHYYGVCSEMEQRLQQLRHSR